MPKKRKVPAVLWRLFRERACTLSTAIISLLPSPPSPGVECRYCKGRRRLCCIGADALSLLLRPTDPSDYRKLLNKCFVVVSQNAPPLLHFYPDSHWSQHQIVVRSIEMIFSEQSSSSNVICSGYDGYNQSSPLVELLTSSAWCLLLERVGDEIMAYILKNTSIFLPFHRKKYHQVAGRPINKVFFEMFKCTSDGPSQNSRLIRNGTHKKRERDDDYDNSVSKRQVSRSFRVDGTTSSCRGISCLINRHDKDKHCQMGLSEAATETETNLTVTDDNNSYQEVQYTLNPYVPRKRSRPSGWQRHRKRKKSNCHKITEEAPCTRNPVQTDGAIEKCGLKNNGCCYSDKNLWQCSCLVRKVPRKVTKEAQINRKSMFYNMEFSSSVFPRGHVLYSLKPNSSGSIFLVGSIFGLSDVIASPHSKPCCQDTGFTPSGNACECMYHSLTKFFKILIGRAQHCQHGRLLDEHCVVQSPDQNATKRSASSSEKIILSNRIRKKSNELLTYQDCISTQCKNSLEATDILSEPFKAYCQKSQVVSFIWAVCRSIIPPDLLGSSTNWRRLRKNIAKFIQLRRFEKFSLRQCMHKLKTSEFPFLLGKLSFCCSRNQMVEHAEEKSLETSKALTNLKEATHIMKKTLLESWIYWLFSSVVVPLLQANFYVTECEHGKQDVFYYKKSIWEKIKKRAITNLKDQSYSYLDNATARDIVSNRSFGFSKLRLLPKDNGVRLLANLGAPSRMQLQESYSTNCFSGKQRRTMLSRQAIRFHHFKPVNSVLRNTYAVLRAMKLKDPEKLGSSVFDYNDVYRRLCPFLLGLRNVSSTMPNVFIIVSDVSKAFDSIDQNKLLCIMKDVLTKDEYTLKQSCQVSYTKNSLWVRNNFLLLDQDNSSMMTSSVPFCSTNSILVNQERIKSLKKDEIFLNLNEHVKRNLLQLDKRFYLQRVGIAQGSVLSSLLCSLFYGDMDRNVIFPFLNRTREPSHAQYSKDKVSFDNSYMLLRFIDDFLFMSTSKQQAENFFYRLQRGFRDYNCYMNQEKFCLNFNIGHISELPPKRVCIGEDGISFIRWSGLLINCCTLEVQADYTKYLNSHLSSSLTVCWQGKPGRTLKAKMCSYMRPKCHPIFFDSNINSPGVVRLNIFQAFLLCAMKFHCYVSELSHMHKFRPGFYLHIIRRSFRYMHSLIKQRMNSLRGDSNVIPVLQLEDGEVEWLGLNAYIQVLNRKQSRHKKLLSFLKSKLLSGCASSHQNYAVDASHSSLIWKIKY
ncbi:hypothetical protein UlMin_010948 [Ulmus minor]